MELALTAWLALLVAVVFFRLLLLNILRSMIQWGEEYVAFANDCLKVKGHTDLRAYKGFLKEANFWYYWFVPFAAALTWWPVLTPFKRKIMWWAYASHDGIHYKEYGSQAWSDVMHVFAVPKTGDYNPTQLKGLFAALKTINFFW